MSKGNYTIGYLETSVSAPARPYTSTYSMTIMSDDGIGHGHLLSKADAHRIAKKIKAFKAALRADMMASEKRFNGGKR